MAPTGNEHVQVTVDGDTATAALRGDFDMEATFTVEPALERALDRPGLRALELDLSALRFIDSTGLGVLMRLQNEAERRAIALTILPGPRDVMRVFEMAGLSDALPFAPPEQR